MSTVKWVAGGNSMAYSYNGINWTQVNTSAIFTYIMSVAHSGTIWIAGSQSGQLLGYSYDGISWTKSANGTAIFQQVNGVAYGNGKFVAVGGNNTYSIAYSTNGINWTGCANASFFGTGGYGYCVTYNNSTWVVGAATTGIIGYSSDGINWTSVNTGLTSINGIDWNGTYWVAVGNNIKYSSNLTSWSSTTGAAFPTQGRAVKWKNGKFIAVGQDNAGSVQFKTSTTGTSWTSSSPANCTNPMFTINYSTDTSLWVIGKDGTYPIIYSSDGVTWTNSPSTFSNMAGIRSVAVALPAPNILGSVPVINSITTGKTSLTVNFTLSTGGSPAPITYYYSLNGGANYTNANTTTSPITINGLQVATTYNVALIANNLAGNTAASNVVSATIPAIGSVPAITSITPGNLSFNINFTPSTGGYPAPTTYYYSLDGGANYINANTTTSPITITGLQIATTYKVSLIANSTLGNTAASSSTEVVLLPLF